MSAYVLKVRIARDGVNHDGRRVHRNGQPTVEVETRCGLYGYPVSAGAAVARWCKRCLRLRGDRQ
jgi:hypothetical protein